MRQKYWLRKGSVVWKKTDFPSDTGSDRKEILREATFSSEGRMRKEKWNKSGQIEKLEKVLPLRKWTNYYFEREKKGRKCPKKDRKRETSSWTEGLPVVRQLSVLHKGELLLNCVPSVRACHQVWKCVCVCEWGRESALHIPSTLDKNSIRSF